MYVLLIIILYTVLAGISAFMPIIFLLHQLMTSIEKAGHIYAYVWKLNHKLRSISSKVLMQTSLLCVQKYIYI